MPKIPSARITDLALSISSSIILKNIGIRPGEKLHEVMWPSDDSHLTIEFQDHYVITPSISFVDAKNNFLTDAKGELGKPVKQGFEYSSGTNSHFLTINELQEYDKHAEL